MGIEYKGNKKIAILHDYLHVLGGTEKVLEVLLETFPNATIFTSFYNKSLPSKIINEAYIKGRIVTSLLDKLPKTKLLEKIYRRLSFFVFNKFDLSKFDLLITNTSGPSTWVKKSNNLKLITYYHKIPSFEFLGIRDELNKRSPELLSRAVNNGEILLSDTRSIFNIIDKYFHKRNRKYVDQIDLLVANSIHYSKNFRILYGISPKVIYPPINEEHLMDISKFKSEKGMGDYYVYLGRLEKYKGIEYIIDSCIRMNKKLKVIGNGSLKGKLPIHPLIEYLGYVDDLKKYEILSNSLALINGSREDFGIVYLDALCTGTPVIAFGEGGVLEIATSELNAIFFDTQNAKSLMDAIVKFEESNLVISEDERMRIIKKFGKERFKEEILNIIC